MTATNPPKSLMRRTLFSATFALAAVFSRIAFANNVGYRFPPASTSAPNNHHSVIFPFSIASATPDPQFPIEISSSVNLRSDNAVVGTATITQAATTTSGGKSNAVVHINLTSSYITDVRTLNSAIVKCSNTNSPPQTTTVTCTTQPTHPLNTGLAAGSIYVHNIIKQPSGDYDFAVYDVKKGTFYSLATVKFSAVKGLGSSSFKNTLNYKGAPSSCSNVRPFGYMVYPPTSTLGNTVYFYNVERDTSIPVGPCPSATYPVLEYGRRS